MQTRATATAISRLRRLRWVIDAGTAALGLAVGLWLSALSTGCPHCPENCEPGPIIPEGLYKVVDLDLEDAWLAGVDANHAVLEVRERGRRLEFTFDHPNDGPTSVRFAREGPALPDDCP